MTTQKHAIDKIITINWTVMRLKETSKKKKTSEALLKNSKIGEKLTLEISKVEGIV